MPNRPLIKLSMNNIFVAMSGGVDSSVTAALLKEQGFNVRGFYMKNWTEDVGGSLCPWKEDLDDARAVAEKIGIPFDVVNFQREYKQRIVDYMVEGYKIGLAPNPDIICNKEIKFKLFLDKCVDMGADFVATGHYARIRDENGRKKLLKGADTHKDQTYFLYALNQKQLSRAVFPIGEYIKEEVRNIARKFGLKNAEKKDSQGLCCVGKIDFHEFLKQYLPVKKGAVKTKTGEIAGRHDGVWFYTYGQRHGIGSFGGGNPYFVIGKDFETNTLIVGTKDDEADLYSRVIEFKNPNWISGVCPSLPFKCTAMIRYRQTPSQCVVLHDGETLKAIFAKPQRSATPGQSIVLYDGNECLGGGVIV